MNSEQQYIDLYEQSRGIINSHSVAIMNAHREASFEVFCKHGLPTRNEERYRYIDLQGLFAPNYGVNFNRLLLSIDPYKTFKCFIPNLKSALYFVVNDIFYVPPKPSLPLQEGIIIDSFKNFERTYPKLLSSYYNHLAHDRDAVCSLNTMLTQDGIVVYVKKNVHVEQPIQVVNILHSGVDIMSNRRILIVMEEHSELNILFCDHVESNVNFLSTQVMEVFMGEGATLGLMNIEETHAKNRLVSNIFIEQQAYSKLTHNAFTLHNGITRNGLEVLMRGKGATCWLNGCAILDKEQRADNNTLIKHEVGHCDSRELYKYVLNDASRGAFAGKVLVCDGSQKTNSVIKNQNLCATKEARMWTQPMLEIYADDVKCSHGATVGQLNDAAMFYMRQRGISLDEAKRLLETAFVREVIDNIQLQPLRERLQYLVEKRFRGELNKCEGCSLCM